MMALYTLIKKTDDGERHQLGRFETAQDGAEAMDEYRYGDDEEDVYLMLVREDDDD